MLKGLAEVQKLGGGPARDGKRSLPPVHLWNPPFCGDLPMVIKRDGTWHYMNSPIGRKPLVRLFSTILRHDEDGKFYLVTPVEKCAIEVEDAPFLAVEVQVQGGGKDQLLTFRTNVDDEVTAGPDAPMRFVINPVTKEPSPYVFVRDRLEALINRAVFYELVNLGVEEEYEGDTHFGVWSGGVFFPICLASELHEGLA